VPGAGRVVSGSVAAMAVLLVVTTGGPAAGSLAVSHAGPSAGPSGEPELVPLRQHDATREQVLGAPLRPDLVALPARGPLIQRLDGVRWLRFGSVLGNSGVGPVEIRQNRNRRCPPGQHNASQITHHDANGDGVYEPLKDTEVTRRQAGCMVYHPEHQHWHFRASARYALLDPSQDGRVVVTSRRKVSFCLRDTERLPVRYGRWDYPSTYGACSSRSRQGLSVGWADVYQSYLAGQALELPRGLPDGLYCLETVVDPLDQLTEVDDTNNSSVRAVVVRGDRVAVRPAGRCR
jgi:hypothetical protein